jgi:hypothetical protein
MDSLIKIPDIVSKTQSDDEYWKMIAQGRKVEPLKKPCGDCAITTGFYLEYAEMLRKQPIEIQNKVLDTWYCHNSCNRGCAGIRNFLKKNYKK